MIFVILAIIGLFLWGTTYGILFVLKKTSFFSDRSEEEVIKLDEYRQKWSPVDIYSVTGTRFYSIIKTKDDHYFLVNHFSPKFSAINLFRKVDKWHAVSISKLDAERLQEKTLYDYTMIGVATVSTLLAIYVSNYKVTWHFWFTNKLAVSLFIFLALIGIIIGVIRMAKSIDKFKAKEKDLFINAKRSIIKLKSNQKYILYLYLGWLLMFYWLPISLHMKIILVPIVFEEVVVRLYSSIGKVRKKKFDEEVSWINKKIYGKDAYYTDVSTPSEIFNDYQGESMRKK
ncbi:hypothetical protein [Pseudolactococcus reticulitermitis]|uniref:Uncharacterized protein n=1 Tax=Pseudolactococcus reticulitermitis TaxID=2025039 RepID=A0A224X3S4_9LACT|nr:hypothetical protein [Lactococcus reticulitermitis]GAX47366.1 hypothetical protein RsY01_966 [Lactococcus reticulitermitis]